MRGSAPSVVTALACAPPSDMPMNSSNWVWAERGSPSKLYRLASPPAADLGWRRGDLPAGALHRCVQSKTPGMFHRVSELAWEWHWQAAALASQPAPIRKLRLDSHEHKPGWYIRPSNVPPAHTDRVHSLLPAEYAAL